MIKKILKKVFVTKTESIHTSSNIKEVLISECVHYCGFRYGGKDYNPYQTYILNKQNNVPVNENKKQFVSFLKYYRPNNMAEALSIGLERNTPAWIYPWDNHSKQVFDSKNNWFEDPDEVQDIITQYSEKGIPSFRIDQEFYWLDRALDNITTENYQPEKYGFLNVLMFEKKNNETSFLVLDGNHRLSSLYALGNKKVRVNIKKDSIVKEKDLDDWPGVKAGYFLKKDALAIFNQYFIGNKNYFKADKPAKILDFSNDYGKLTM